MYKLAAVTRIRTVVVLAAVLLWAATPAVACWLTAYSASTAQHGCCHETAGHCGGPVMPVSHACCQAPTYPETVVVQGQTSSPLKPGIAVLAASFQVFSPDLLAGPQVSLAFSESPPGNLPSGSILVLRI